MKGVVIIHFNPVENYPPAINFINYFTREEKTANLYVFTTSNGKRPGRVSGVMATGKLRVEYLSPTNREISFFLRIIRSGWFYLYVLLRLILLKPDSILYYETMSSWPALMYKKIRKKVKVHAHYHEYNTIDEQRKASLIIRFSWNFEKKNFSLLSGISHTNEKRMELFKKDYALIDFSNSMVLPNYPPRSWIVQSAEKQKTSVLKVVYVGYGLSLESMYVKEFFSWVKKQDGKISLDCYIQYLDPAAKIFYDELNCLSITIKDPVNYFDLPQLFSKYDVGVILYKGHLLNFVYNAPNKLFEYLACGLNVWFPKVMIGSLAYVNTESLPKVIAMDFNDLGNFDWNNAEDQKGLRFIPSPYYYEKVYCNLLSKLA